MVESNFYGSQLHTVAILENPLPCDALFINACAIDAAKISDYVMALLPADFSMVAGDIFIHHANITIFPSTNDQLLLAQEAFLASGLWRLPGQVRRRGG